MNGDVKFEIPIFERLFFKHSHNNNNNYNNLYLGLGVDNEVLDSAEFYDLTADKWTQTSALKVGRTEHVMSLVYGIPTVIGGKDRH